MKGQVDARGLARAIGYAIERSRAQVALAHQALHDPLTGLANRALFEDRLRQALARVAPPRRRVGGALLRPRPLQGRQRHASATPRATSCSSRSPAASPASCAPRTRRRASGATSSRSSARTSTAPTTRWRSPSGCSTSCGRRSPASQDIPVDRVDRRLDRPRGHRAPGGAAARGGRCHVPREGPRRWRRRALRRRDARPRRAPHRAAGRAAPRARARRDAPALPAAGAPGDRGGRRRRGARALAAPGARAPVTGPVPAPRGGERPDRAARHAGSSRSPAGRPRAGPTRVTARAARASP